MKTFLLAATAVVALAAGPAFAGGVKTMQRSSAAMPADTLQVKPPASEPGGCPSNQPMCGGWVQTEDGRMMRPNRMQQDAREQAVTSSLNNEVQGGFPAGTMPQLGGVPASR